MNSEVMETAVCDECESAYYRCRSPLSRLCPECASILYGYPPCKHSFADGRCIHCYWNGKHSQYIQNTI